MQDDRRASLFRRLNYLLTILCAQAACLGVGLWMQHQFLHSSGHNAALDQAWADLSRTAASIVQDGSAALDGDAALVGVDSADAMRAALGTGPAAVILVDANWHVISRVLTGSTGAAGVSPGDLLSWRPSDVSGGGSQDASRGLITLDGVSQVASVVPLGHDGNRVVAYRPLATVEESAEAILASLPALSGLTFVWTFALLGISAYMIFSRFYEHAERVHARAVADGLRKRQDLVRTRDSVVFGLAKLADSRDPETGDHLERISVYSTILASALRHHPKYRRHVTPAFIRLLGISSVLHDIGKVGIEDRILLKKGSLTAAERIVIQTHAAIGGECLRGIERRLGSSNFLQMAREIAFAHHERWDGTGYPMGLAGEEIPLAARIVAIADVYDALSSKRVYKERHPLAVCEKTIRDAAGSHFDPDLVDAWLEVAPKFATVALRYASEDPDDAQSGRSEAGSVSPHEESFDVDAEPVGAGREPVLAATGAPAGGTTPRPGTSEQFFSTPSGVGHEDQE